MTITIDNLTSGLDAVTKDKKRRQAAVRQYKSAPPTMSRQEAVQIALKKAVHGLKDEDEKYEQAVKAAGITNAARAPASTTTTTQQTQNVKSTSTQPLRSVKAHLSDDRVSMFILGFLGLVIGIWIVYVTWSYFVLEKYEDKGTLVYVIGVVLVVVYAAAVIVACVSGGLAIAYHHIRTTSTTEVTSDDGLEELEFEEQTLRRS